jgi:hypothetical protein
MSFGGSWLVSKEFLRGLGLPMGRESSIRGPGRPGVLATVFGWPGGKRSGVTVTKQKVGYLCGYVEQCA